MAYSPLLHLCLGCSSPTHYKKKKKKHLQKLGQNVNTHLSWLRFNSVGCSFLSLSQRLPGRNTNTVTSLPLLSLISNRCSNTASPQHRYKGPHANVKSGMKNNGNCQKNSVARLRSIKFNIYVPEVLFGFRCLSFSGSSHVSQLFANEE